MAVKAKNPVQIRDPSGKNHIVKVFPNQTFEVILSRDYAKEELVTLFVTSNLFSLISDEYDELGRRVMKFEQSRDLSDWAKISSAYLGDITLFIGEEGERKASLCVMLDGSQAIHPNIITVINPNGMSLKLEPYQILEVVVFGEGVHGAGPALVECPKGDVQLEMIHEHTCFPQVTSHAVCHAEHAISTCFVMPRCTFSQRVVTERHFFFRYNVDSLSKIYELSNGTYDGGRVSISMDMYHGSSAARESFNLPIELNVRDRSKRKAFPVLFFPEKFLTISNASLLSFAGTSRTATHKPAKVEEYEDGYDDWGYNAAYAQCKPKPAYQPFQQQHWENRSFYFKEAILEKRIEGPITSGCRLAQFIKVPLRNRFKNCS